ncbi:hypothetical protein [Tautonia rosea]|uniref:hypothetical protein n=1 Tax=Tautonia rosea TaxID=2728037 RepID=UPI0014748A3C|nr:hypothetical protein [Tautonia rosea]
MTRADQILYRERFEAKSGETFVLTAYDPNRLAPDPSSFQEHRTPPNHLDGS